MIVHPSTRHCHRTTKKRSIDFTKSKIYTEASRFINDLKKVDQIALRLGQLSFTGWKVGARGGSLIPDFKQKSVDMKIGLDMAWMAGRKTIDKLVLVAGDSDFVSPMKLVRREGILVYVYTMGQKEVKDHFTEHADFILQD